MDQGLFKKHLLTIKTIQETQEEVCAYIQKETGILLNKEELHITKKSIILTISSVKRSQLLQKNIKLILEKKGYRLA